jgi:CO/xanthine dehydrogenase FAD-binding subunit
MKPLPRFRLHRPGSIAEALGLLSSLDDAKPIAGGTDLVPLLRDVERGPRNLVCVGQLGALSYLREEDGMVTIGATTTLSRLLESDTIKRRAQGLHDAVYQMGSVQIRNLGTIGGNLCNASPAADTAPPLLVLDSDVTVASEGESRTMPLADFFVGPKISSLKPYELLTEVRFPAQQRSSGSAFHRIGRRKGFTLSVVSAAAYIERDGEYCRRARIALGSVAPTPIRVPEAEGELEGKEVTEALFEDIGVVCRDHIHPIDDVRGSASYRKGVSGVLVNRALKDAWIRAGGELI